MTAADVPFDLPDLVADPDLLAAVLAGTLGDDTPLAHAARRIARETTDPDYEPIAAFDNSVDPPADADVIAGR